MKTKTLIVLAIANASLCAAVACTSAGDSDADATGDALTNASSRATVFHTTPVDRIGRPAISAVVLNMTAEPNEKDNDRVSHVKWYDALDSFSGADDEGSKQERIIDELTKGLELMDHSDGSDDFTAAETAAWVDLFKEDALIVDVSKPCGVVPDATAADDSTHSYLDIEKEMIDKDHVHATCGGRTPKDDTVDVFMTFSIAHKDWHPGARDWKSTPEHVGDLIDNASAATNDFPYLALPHTVSIPSIPLADSVNLDTGKAVRGDFSEIVGESAKATFGSALKALWTMILASLGVR